QKSHRGLLFQMKIAQPPYRFRRDQWSVARQNDDMIVADQRLLRDHECVASASLFSLEQKLDAGMFEYGSNPFRFMPDDGVHISCRHDLRSSGDGMGQERLASNLM